MNSGEKSTFGHALNLLSDFVEFIIKLLEVVQIVLILQLNQTSSGRLRLPWWEGVGSASYLACLPRGLGASCLLGLELQAWAGNLLGGDSHLEP